MSAISCSKPTYGDLMVNKPLPPTAPDAVCALNDFEGRLLKLPQEPVSTFHVLHGGMYARTVRLKPDTVIVGCLYKVPTMLIVNGHAQVFIGDGWAEFDGYNVLPASSGRKQVFVALGDVEITMVFATKVQTVEEAEAEMTDGALLSRIGENIYVVTGE